MAQITIQMAPPYGATLQHGDGIYCARCGDRFQFVMVGPQIEPADLLRQAGEAWGVSFEIGTIESLPAMDRAKESDVRARGFIAVEARMVQSVASEAP